jgi:putative aminopeptidase FrvX
LTAISKITLLALAGSLSSFTTVSAQSNIPSTTANLHALTETLAVTGYEDRLGSLIKSELAGLHPQQDAMGNITVTLGSGAPHRLIAAPIDEPGYVVSRIDNDGYLRLQRLPQGGLPAHFNELQNAQPMVVTTRDGKLLPAVTAGLSIHLEPGRRNVPDPDDLDTMYLDMGASSAAEVHRSGVDVLSPLAAERHLLPVGQSMWSGTAVGDRFGAVALLALAKSLSAGHLNGSVTLAFVVQQWAGARGLSRVLESERPDELIYLGRAMQTPHAASEERSKGADTAYRAKPGTGIWLCPNTSSVGSNGDVSLVQELEKAGAILHPGSAAGLLPPGYGSPVPLPNRTVHLSIPIAWPATAAETLDKNDLTQLIQAVANYLQIKVPETPARDNVPLAYSSLPPKPTTAPSSESILRTLTLSYGVSEQEKMTREAVERVLPPWAHPVTDAGGNLILHLGKATGKPGIVLMAHLDELGFRVRSILPNGSLDLENKGGGSPAFYWGHPAVVHTTAGMRAGVLELPDDYDTPQFHFPADFRVAATMFVGANNAEEVAALGIHVGDSVTIPKHYRNLLGTRISERSLDDRVGCAAMIRAVWMLGPDFKDNNVTFVWSTREELGLLGAGEYAATTAKIGQTPATVFAIDTFVSSDSPIESHRFADAPLGQGFVVRAIDNSYIARWKDVQKLQLLAQQHKIPVQYGVTGGGNDGSAFIRYGSASVTLSWPLRYSHSPAELIDSRDLDALSAISEVIARSW